MSDMELVTVIVPVYNMEAYLPRCIQSICAQSYEHLEIILVEDGSSDASPALCRRFAEDDSRIQVLSNSGKGLSAARNTGLQAAHGAYVFMVDSDDYIASHAILDLYTAMQETGADLAIGDFKKGCDAAYDFPPVTGKKARISAREALHRSYGEDHDRLRYIAAWCKLYKRGLFEQIWYPDGKLFEDIYTTHKLLARCSSIVIVEDILSYYFQRPDSLMNHSFHPKKLDYLGALEERIAFFQTRRWNELETMAYDDLLHALVWEYSRARDILHDRQIMRRIWDTFRRYYRKGHVSRYPSDTKALLWAFSIHPELVVWYWRVRAKLSWQKKKEGS